MIAPDKLAARLAARLVHEFRAELGRLTPASDWSNAQQNCTSAVTQTTWQGHPRAPASAVARLDGIGFTAKRSGAR